MAHTTCTFCSLNEQAYGLRTQHGANSEQYRSALAELAPFWALARVGKACSPGCGSNAPLVRFG